MAIAAGSPAPEISLPDQNGSMHSLSQYRGQWVLLYFYPKDDTSGCTKEACAIRDDFRDFGLLAATVFGVSTDSVSSHKKFAEKYQLPFTLLADTEKKAVEAYDVWHPKKFMGKEYMGTMRQSFLIAPDGAIAKVYEKVDPLTHAQEVLTDLRAFAH